MTRRVRRAAGQGEGRTRGVRAEVPITQDMIVETAFRLIDERGTEGFSMRSLATELGVFPATLYWHVGDRAQLLGLVEQQWMSGIAVPDDTDWREWMRRLGRNYRRHAHRHPNVARLMSVERARNTDNLTVPDAVIGKIAALGFGDDLVHAYNAVVGAVQGFVVIELARVGEPGPEVVAATEADWGTEYLAPVISVKVVRSLDEAIDHINTHGSHHTDAILTTTHANAMRFLREVDSASVMVNASTRFADGFEYGLGAEIGISTDKFHARGPVGLEGLTSQKWVVLGHGEIRG